MEIYKVYEMQNLIDAVSKSKKCILITSDTCQTAYWLNDGKIYLCSNLITGIFNQYIFTQPDIVKLLSHPLNHYQYNLSESHSNKVVNCQLITEYVGKRSMRELCNLKQKLIACKSIIQTINVMITHKLEVDKLSKLTVNNIIKSNINYNKTRASYLRYLTQFNDLLISNDMVPIDISKLSNKQYTDELVRGELLVNNNGYIS